MRVPLVWIPVVLFSASSILSAQPQNFTSQHLTVEDGLSQNTINCIFQDSNGFLWFGTNDGLNKYDGNILAVT